MNKSQFEKFTATHLYCPKCKRAMPTKERLLLILPDGNLYSYECVYCHTSLGTKKETKSKFL
jgi:polyferredoxin